MACETTIVWGNIEMNFNVFCQIYFGNVNQKDEVLAFTDTATTWENVRNWLLHRLRANRELDPNRTRVMPMGLIAVASHRLARLNVEGATFILSKLLSSYGSQKGN